ncbi:MAG: phospho-N-acetylmuramoyl-pentapeptide-transferase [Lachnospiraceae bacterium]|nr:phospho-N-acetylmuramoyl-pentapeptide-transferase [Lachnospiraceae bacterium]
MLYNILPLEAQSYQLPVAMAFAFAATFLMLYFLAKYLPRDGGRAFAVEGEKSAGKPRGAGVIFIPVFTTVASIFAPMSNEHGFYLILVIAAMLTGFLDDASKSPWGEYLKGALDLVVAILTTAVFMTHNSTQIDFAVFNTSFVMPKWLFAILAVVVIWVSINVTNCSDGVDGLSGSVSIASLMGFFTIMQKIGIEEEFTPLILILITGLAAYLWFNATPSKLMMGDAGSRAIGLFIAICALKTHDPFLFLQLALVMLFDGGLGLIKVFLLRFLKIHILKNVRTPLHDHVRKVWGWSNTQCVYRFTIIQLVVCSTVYFLV